MGHRIPLCTFLLAAAGCGLAGCRVGVPVHVWQPPELASTVGSRVAVATVADDEVLAEQVKRRFFEHAPRDTGRQTTLVDAAGLNDTGIRLVSAVDDESNDLAVATRARSAGIDYVLRGEIFGDRYPHQDGESVNDLKVSWRLSSLREGRVIGGKPVVVDLKSAIDRYPDLGLLSDPQQIIVTAAARQTHRLITPSVERDRVQIEIAYLLPGSREVRRGNAAAMAGRWGEAESIWSDVIEKHPSQVAALHNLALAAAAGQDFSRARKLARKAIRLRPTSLHKQTLVWIELQQRAYHEAFDLPDPPEGWLITQGVPTHRIEPDPTAVDRSANRPPESRR